MFRQGLACILLASCAVSAELAAGPHDVLSPQLLERGTLLVDLDFEEELSTESWNLKGDWSHQTGGLRYRSTDQKVVFGPKIRSAAFPLPIGDLIMELSFSWHEQTERVQVVFNDEDGHALVLEFRDDFHSLMKWKEREPLTAFTEYPDVAGSSLKAAEMMTLMIEIRGEDVLARINDENFLVGSAARFARKLIPLQVCFQGGEGRLHSYKIWTGRELDKTGSALLEWQARRNERPPFQSAASQGFLYAEKVAALRSQLRESADHDYADLIQRLEERMRAMKDAYWFYGVSSKNRRAHAERQRAINEDPRYRSLTSELKKLQNEELFYIFSVDAELVDIAPKGLRAAYLRTATKK